MMTDYRLRCCVCGADLGSAEDPYRDPDCMDCLRREYEHEMQADREAWDRQQELIELGCNPTPERALTGLLQEMDDASIDVVEAFWRGELGHQNVAVLAVSVIERERNERHERAEGALRQSGEEPSVPVDLPF